MGMKKPGKPRLDWIQKVLDPPPPVGERARVAPLRLVWQAGTAVLAEPPQELPLPDKSSR
jgi:hypothetical protein